MRICHRDTGVFVCATVLFAVHMKEDNMVIKNNFSRILWKLSGLIVINSFVLSIVIERKPKGG